MIVYVAYFLIGLGLFFFFGSALGLLRFPDFYTRMHAAGKGDTLSTMLMLCGCALIALHEGHFDLASILVSLKLLMVTIFIFFGSPAATHAIMDAGYRLGVKHWVKPGKKQQ